jgi:hypothetical protein
LVWAWEPARELTRYAITLCVVVVYLSWGSLLVARDAMVGFCELVRFQFRRQKRREEGVVTGV